MIYAWANVSGNTSKTALGFRTDFIVNPWFDSVFFIWSPVLALALGAILSVTHLNQAPWDKAGDERAIHTVLIGIFIHAHLFAVFFRSHANREIRRSYPWRFLAVPPALFVAMLISDWALVCVSVLATFWDVYHSGLQTFGLGRIYDLKAGNDAVAGRRLDWWLNHLLYAGPIIAGVTMMDHFEDFREFEDVGTTLFNAVPAFMDSNQRYFAWALLFGGGAFLLYYLWSYYRMHCAGRHVSLPKVCLLTATGVCSIYSWGFNSWGEAFFIMNLFHAWQYFAIVWWKEGPSMSRLFRTERLRLKGLVTLLLFLGVTLGYGYLIEVTPADITAVYALSLVVSIMHFWYDGFIWSVQKRQV